MQKYTVMDLFCGGGLGALGVKNAGFELVYAIDNNRNAVNTYNKNISNCCVMADIRKINISDLPDVDVILGSPVCKPFSSAGNRKGFEDEKYGDLVSHYVNIIKIKSPKAFVFENVKGMVSKKNKMQFDCFLDILKDSGYIIQYKVLNAQDYSIPQSRERLIVVGLRNDLKETYKFPEKACRKVTIKECLIDLPKPTIIMNSSKDIQYRSNFKFPNHKGYGIRKDESLFIKEIPSGGNWRNLCENDAKSFLEPAYESGGGKTGFLRKVDINKTAYTITSTMNGKNNAQILNNKDLYPDNYQDMPCCRRFTVRECLRLQSVPDSYVIDDSISLSKQYEIVGNGIPSLLMTSIFNELKKIL